MPRLNFRFCVLCRKRYIPRSAPMLLPAIDIPMRVASGMRHFPLRAFHLSIPIKIEQPFLALDYSPKAFPSISNGRVASK